MFAPSFAWQFTFNVFFFISSKKFCVKIYHRERRKVGGGSEFFIPYEISVVPSVHSNVAVWHQK